MESFAPGQYSRHSTEVTSQYLLLNFFAMVSARIFLDYVLKCCGANGSLRYYPVQWLGFNPNLR